MENCLIEEIKEKGCIVPNDELTYENNKLYLEIKFNNIIKNPYICKKIVDVIKTKICNLNFDYILSFNMNCVPFASVLSSVLNKPMLIMNNDHSIMGDYNEDDKILVLKDIVFSYSDLVRSVNIIDEKKILISHFISIFNYEFTNSIDFIQLDNTSFSFEKDYEPILIVSNFINLPVLNKIKDNIKPTDLTRKIINIIEKKKTCIIYKSHLFDKTDILDEINKYGNHILGFYFQAEGIADFDTSFIDELKEISKKMDFILIVDKKFDDHYNAVFNQYSNSLYNYPKWIDVISTFGNKNSIDALNRCNANILLLRSNKHNLNHCIEDNCSNTNYDCLQLSYIKYNNVLNLYNFEMIEDNVLEEYIIDKIKNDYNLTVVDSLKFDNIQEEHFYNFILKLKDLMWKCQIKISVEDIKNKNKNNCLISK